MPTEITVTGCGDCPFANDEVGIYFCMHPQLETPPYTNIFDTCPLKTDSITIKLKQDENSTKPTIRDR